MNETSKIYKELSNEELTKIIESYFKNKVEFEAKLISGGLFNTTYHIKVDNVKKELILRVGPVNKHLILPFERNLMKAEEYVYDLCNKNEIPCSNMLLCDVSNTIINRDYMLVEYIDSKIISDIKVSKEIEDKLYEEVGIYISRLHNIKSNKFGRVYDVYNGEGFDLWSDCLLDEVLKYESKSKEFDIFKEDELNLFKSIIYKYKNILDEIETPYLIHADLWTGNILVKEENGDYSIAAIIDADRAICGDTDFEFANSWITNESLFKGYSKSLNNDAKSKIRRKIYRLLQLLIDTYVYFVEFDKYEWGLDSKTNSIKLANEILQSK
ncbi:MAG: phosphotransferase [Romboutsia sp.]|uniref:phosphotransferase n=1 Tax=Romboutsia sp. TaxID=1965302 RepID=UPI003F395F35